MAFRYIISVEDVPLDAVGDIFKRAADYKHERLRPQPPAEMVFMNNYFCEESTRTRTSFHVAGKRLHWEVIGTENAKFSSSMAGKGEDLEDSIAFTCGHYDVLVVRHWETQSVASLIKAARGVPFINGGDGINEHPSQTFLDEFTARERFPGQEDLVCTIAGDIGFGRVAHSLLKRAAIGKRAGRPWNLFGKFNLVSNKEYGAPADLIEHVRRSGVEVNIFEEFSGRILKETDIWYMMRIQGDRRGLPEDARLRATGQIALHPTFAQEMKETAIIMHPGPRREELPKWWDTNDHRFFVWKQADNGMWMRMAMLGWVHNDF